MSVTWFEYEDFIVFDGLVSDQERWFKGNGFTWIGDNFPYIAVEKMIKETEFMRGKRKVEADPEYTPPKIYLDRTSSMYHLTGSHALARRCRMRKIEHQESYNRQNEPVIFVKVGPEIEEVLSEIFSISTRLIHEPQSPTIDLYEQTLPPEEKRKLRIFRGDSLIGGKRKSTASQYFKMVHADDARVIAGENFRKSELKAIQDYHDLSKHKAGLVVTGTGFRSLSEICSELYESVIPSDIYGNL
jgi:hypothetical protein